jgi:hypothetical protein
VRQGQGGVRRAVADGLRTLGYDTAVCKSRWEKTPTYQAGIEALFRSRRNHGRDLDFSPAPHVRPSLTVQSELWPHKLESSVASTRRDAGLSCCQGPRRVAGRITRWRGVGQRRR